MPGEGYVDWYPFGHPELGAVELGGWNSARFSRNPPVELLHGEIEPHADWAVYHLLISPKLEVRSVEAEAVGDGVWRVQAVIQNTGWLPTNVTQKALDKKHVRPVEVDLRLPDGATLRAGKPRTEVGQLDGRALKNSMLGGPPDPTTDRARLEWVLEAPAGAVVEVEARHQRAGTARAAVTLG